MVAAAKGAAGPTMALLAAGARVSGRWQGKAQGCCLNKLPWVQLCSDRAQKLNRVNRSTCPNQALLQRLSCALVGRLPLALPAVLQPKMRAVQAPCTWLLPWATSGQLQRWCGGVRRCWLLTKMVTRHCIMLR